MRRTRASSRGQRVFRLRLAQQRGTRLASRCYIYAGECLLHTQDVLTKLRELKPTITARYKVREMGLFGSYIRGDQRLSSDIDLLAEFEDNADLFDQIGLALYLEEIFQRPVDVVSKQALRAELRRSVLEQVVTV